MSMQKKTLAILVALSVGASFGALANGSSTGHNNGNGHNNGHDHEYGDYWKGKKRGGRGGGYSYSRGDSLRLSVGDVEINALEVTQSIESKQKAELGNFDFDWDQEKNDATADADAKANPDLTSGRQGGNKRHYGYRTPSSEADLASNSADGGTARAMATSNMKVKTGDNTIGNSAAMNGIGTQTAVSGMSVSVQNSVNINASSQF